MRTKLKMLRSQAHAAVVVLAALHLPATWIASAQAGADRPHRDQRMGCTFVQGGVKTFDAPGVPKGMKRSAEVRLTLSGRGEGMEVFPNEADWWKIKYKPADPTGRIKYGPVDLYSLASHEIGHMVIFNPNFATMDAWVNKSRQWACPDPVPARTVPEEPTSFRPQGDSYGLRITDRFARDFAGHGLTLTDWDGYIANPAVKVKFWASPPFQLPVTVDVYTSSPMVYFNGATMSDRGGSRRLIIKQWDEPMAIEVAAFPDRDTHSKKSYLYGRACDALGQCEDWNVPVVTRDLDTPHLITEDPSVYFTSSFPYNESPTGKPLLNPPFPLFELPAPLESSHFTIALDFTQNETDYFSYEVRRTAVREAADDWSYFLEKPPLETVPAGDEKTSFFVFSTDGSTHQTQPAVNPKPFSGLYVYMTIDPNLHNNPIHDNDPTTKDGKLKYFCQNVPDRRVNYYAGHQVVLNNEWHFFAETDAQSLVPAYGVPYAGVMPRGRWIPTKLDLLIARSMGYRLKNIAALQELAFPAPQLADGKVGHPYRGALSAMGGVPDYFWSVEGGELPGGLRLDSYTGALVGTPTDEGLYTFVITLRDSGENQVPISRALQIEVKRN